MKRPLHRGLDGMSRGGSRKDAEQVYDRALNWKPETMNWMKGWIKKKFDVTI
jgi:hypothetical protein